MQQFLRQALLPPEVLIEDESNSMISRNISSTITQQTSQRKGICVFIYDVCVLILSCHIHFFCECKFTEMGNEYSSQSFTIYFVCSQVMADVGKLIACNMYNFITGGIEGG